MDVPAFITAICALLLTVYEIYATRKHNYLAVRPYIKFGWTAGPSEDGIWMKNVGLGTAIITKFQMYHDGKIINSKTLANRLQNSGYDSSLVVGEPGATIQAKDMHWLIRCKDKITDGDSQEEYWNYLVGMKFKIEYECFYQKEQPRITWICPNPLDYVSRKP